MMTEKDIEKMLNESEGLDMSHINKDDILAKARQELYFAAPEEPAETPKKKSSFFSHFTGRRIVPLVAGLACAFALFVGGVALYNENYQTIYIDVNPSVALKLNRFDRVIEVEYLNDDAKNLLSKVDLLGSDIEDALDTVLSKCDEAGFVKEDSEIYISATSKEEESSEKLLSKLKGHAESIKNSNSNKKYSVNTYNTKEEEKEKFDNSKISPAKDKIIKEIVDIDDDYDLDDVEDLKGKSMYELTHIKKNPHKHDKDDELDEDDRNEDDELDEDDREDDRDDDRDDKPEKEEPEKNDHKTEPDHNEKDDEDDLDEDDDKDLDDDNDRDEPDKKPTSSNKKPEKDSPSDDKNVDNDRDEHDKDDRDEHEDRDDVEGEDEEDDDRNSPDKDKRREDKDDD